MDAALSIKFSRIEPTLPSEELEFCEGIRLRSEAERPLAKSAAPASSVPAPAAARGGVFSFQLANAIERISGVKAQPAAVPAAPSVLEDSLSVFVGRPRTRV